MSYLLPHLHSGWAVDQAILAEEGRVVIIRFGHDWDDTCMQVSNSYRFSSAHPSPRLDRMLLNRLEHCLPRFCRSRMCLSWVLPSWFVNFADAEISTDEVSHALGSRSRYYCITHRWFEATCSISGCSLSHFIYCTYLFLEAKPSSFHRILIRIVGEEFEFMAILWSGEPLPSQQIPESIHHWMTASPTELHSLVKMVDGMRKLCCPLIRHGLQNPSLL